jgi:hypothetical protein
LPALALSLAVSADVARQLRTSLVEVLEQNYIVGARVRGLPYRRILIRHALRNAAGPALTILGNDFPLMLAGAVAAEAVFSLPGLGQLRLQSAQTRDILSSGPAVVVSFRDRGQPDRERHLNWLYRGRRDRTSGPAPGEQAGESKPRERKARTCCGCPRPDRDRRSARRAASFPVREHAGAANPLTVNANALFRAGRAPPARNDYLGGTCWYHGRDQAVGAHRSRRSGSACCSKRSPASRPCLGRWFDFAANRHRRADDPAVHFFAVAVTAARGTARSRPWSRWGSCWPRSSGRPPPRWSTPGPSVEAAELMGASKRTWSARAAEGAAHHRGDHGVDDGPRRCWRSRS